MIDYLEKILAMMAGWEDEESGWPERKQASPGEKNSALDEALAVPEAGVRPASGMDRPRRVYIDDRFQVDHLERLIQDGQGQAAASRLLRSGTRNLDRSQHGAGAWTACS